MKFERNEKYTTIAIYAFLVLAAAMLFASAIGNLDRVFAWGSKVATFIQPIIYGCVFAFILNPLLRNIDDRFLPWALRGKIRPKTRRGVAMLLTYLIFFIAIGLFFALVVPQLFSSVASLASNIPAYYRAMQGTYQDLMGILTDSLAGEADEFTVILQSLLQQLITALEGVLDSLTKYVTQSFWSIVTATTRFTTGLINLLLGIVASVYILADREKLFAQLRKIIVALFPKRVCNLLYDIGMDCNRILSGFVIGKVIDSIIIGILCFVFMAATRMPYAVFISVIVGVTNVIPYFGPFIGAIPCIIILLIISPVRALWFTIFIILLQQFDGNILGPKILGDTIGLSALWIIFSIMLFSGLFGILGMFIGVPLFAIIYSLVKRLTAFLLDKKGLPSSTRSYDSDRNKLIK